MANRKNLKSTPNYQISGTKTPQKKPVSPSAVVKPVAKPVAKPVSRPVVDKVDKSALRWLLWGGAAITLVMWLSLNDPFNSPKSWALSISAFWLLGWLGFNFKHFLQNRVLKQATIIAAFFALSLAAAWIATDNKFVGFFGQYGRKTGFLEYLSFIVFFLAAAYLIRLTRTSKLERTVVFMGSILGIYGFFQHYKIDFIKWNYLYNSVLGTLGNPDFAGAMMAILLVLNFGVAIESKHLLWFRAVATLNVLLLGIVIIFSQARQGLLAAGLGIAFVALVWIYQRSKKASLALTGVSLVTGLVVIAGMLNIGPLTPYFYKLSVTYRGDYWRAAVRMFIHHPIFGVGLDRYGANFTQYRDAAQTLRRGPSVLADAAHDVPLQIAATGGIFLLIAFLALFAFTLWRGVIALRQTHGSEQILVAVIFGAWITYEAQSFISIDNIGIAIWGYILSGALIGLSIVPGPIEVKKPVASQAQPVVSGLLASLLLVVSFLFYQSESAFHSLAAILPPKDPKLLKEYESFANKPLAYIFKDPTFVFTAGRDYQQVGDTTKAIATFTGLISNDPRNLEALKALSTIYSAQKDWPNAIGLDKTMVKLDPYDPAKLLQLGRDEKSSGDLAAAKAVIPIINSFAPNSPEAKLAQTEFGQ